MVVYIIFSFKYAVILHKKHPVNLLTALIEFLLGVNSVRLKGLDVKFNIYFLELIIQF